MSNISPLLLDSTGKDIASALVRQNFILAKWASQAGAEISTLAEIQAIVRSGKASEVFDVGDQIIVPYTRGANTYDMPFDIAKFENVELQDGEIVPGMYLHSHYAIPDGIPFDAAEAFYVNETAASLAAGTYHITLSAAWSSAAAGDYQFVLPVDLPVGGRLVAFFTAPDSGMTGGKLTMYTSDGKTKVTGGTDIAVTSGSDGTSLGTIAPTTGGTLNPLHYVAYGRNDWSKGSLRQFLNSSAAIDAWWTSQHKYDIAPSQLSTVAGFMAGFEQEFLDILKKVKVSTGLNTVIEDGSLVTTYDTFFPPSLEEIYNTKQVAGEGTCLPYWKRALGRTTPAAQGVVYEAYKTYAIENHSSAQNVRLRSAHRGYGYNAWYQIASGYVISNYSSDANRCAPLCVIA